MEKKSQTLEQKTSQLLDFQRGMLQLENGQFAILADVTFSGTLEQYLDRLMERDEESRARRIFDCITQGRAILEGEDLEPSLKIVQKYSGALADHGPY